MSKELNVSFALFFDRPLDIHTLESGFLPKDRWKLSKLFMFFSRLWSDRLQLVGEFNSFETYYIVKSNCCFIPRDPGRNSKMRETTVKDLGKPLGKNTKIFTSASKIHFEGTCQDESFSWRPWKKRLILDPFLSKKTWGCLQDEDVFNSSYLSNTAILPFNGGNIKELPSLKLTAKAPKNDAFQ